MTHTSSRFFFFGAVAFAAAVLPAQVPYTSPLLKVSVNTVGAPLNGPVLGTAVSATGTTVLLLTSAQNVGVGAPVPGRADLYARDVLTGAIDLVGIGVVGDPTGSDFIHMSADGRFVAFEAICDNMPAFTPNGVAQVFVRDRQTGLLELVSRNFTAGFCDGSRNVVRGISADGRYVLFGSDATNLPAAPVGQHLYRYDRQTGSYFVCVVSMAGLDVSAGLNWASMSANGRYVTFPSFHADLVPGDTNGAPDVFVRDLSTGVTERVSVATGGGEFAGWSNWSSAVSTDGRFVVFTTQSANLLPGVSGIGYAVRDRWSGTTRPLALSLSGVPARSTQGDPLRFIDRTNMVLFASSVPLLTLTGNHTQAYVTDLDDGAVWMLSAVNGVAGNNDSFAPSLGLGGRAVAFVSAATNLTGNPFSSGTDVYTTEFDCIAASNRYGVGKAGTGGIVPQFFGTGGDCNSPVSAAAVGGLGGAPLFVMIGSPSFLPVSIAGSPIHIDLAQPYSLTLVPNGGLPGVPGTGNWFITLPVPSLNNVTYAMQGFFFDPSAVGGFSSTNGLELQVH